MHTTMVLRVAMLKTEATEKYHLIWGPQQQVQCTKTASTTKRKRIMVVAVGVLILGRVNEIFGKGLARLLATGEGFAVAIGVEMEEHTTVRQQIRSASAG